MGIYLLQNFPYRLWVSPNLLLNGYWCSLSELERPEREVFHSPASIGDVWNDWSYISTPLIRLHGADRDKFSFILS